MTAKYAGRGVPRRHMQFQRGQAMVLGMLLAAIAATVLVRYFFAGQAVGAKARQIDALDAAAYSAALLQARSLNMLAYINRAQIGHQVAMAHLVTLASWAALGGTEARQVAGGNPPLYLIGLLFGEAHGSAYAAALKASGLDALARSQGELAMAYAAHDQVVRDTLVSVQDDIVDRLPQARHSVMQAVLHQNYPEWPQDTEFALTLEGDTWAGYLQRHGSGHTLHAYVQGVSALYDFLAPRNHLAASPWIVDARCPHLRHELRRRGATELDAGGRWQSIDTQSFHALRSNRWIGCYYREYAMGWGWIPSASIQAFAGPHVDNPPENFAGQDFWRWVKDSTDWDIASGSANPLANSKAVAARQRWEGGGLAPYHDTKLGSPGSELVFGTTLIHPGPQGLRIKTESAAKTVFVRPVSRADQQVELPNLFHPYWQAKLITHRWTDAARPHS